MFSLLGQLFGVAERKQTGQEISGVIAQLLKEAKSIFLLFKQLLKTTVCERLNAKASLSLDAALRKANPVHYVPIR